MLPEKGTLVICLTIGLVILLNLGLVYSLTRPSMKRQLKLFGDTIKHLHKPWERDEKAMQELHSQVARLQEEEGDGDHVDE